MCFLGRPGCIQTVFATQDTLMARIGDPVMARLARPNWWAQQWSLDSMAQRWRFPWHRSWDREIPGLYICYSAFAWRIAPGCENPSGEASDTCAARRDIPRHKCWLVPVWNCSSIRALTINYKPGHQPQRRHATLSRKYRRSIGLHRTVHCVV